MKVAEPEICSEMSTDVSATHHDDSTINRSRGSQRTLRLYACGKCMSLMDNREIVRHAEDRGQDEGVRSDQDQVGDSELDR